MSGNRDESSIVVNHMIRTAQFLTKNNSSINEVLVWHDALTAVCSDNIIKQLSSYNLKIVVWDYSANISSCAAIFFERILQLGGTPYIATAYKGADGSSEICPDFEKGKQIKFPGKSGAI